MKIAILGATGAIGRAMLEVVEEYGLSVSEMHLYASKRSEGIQIPFQGTMLTVKELTSNSFGGMDYILGALSNELTLFYLNDIKASNAIFIDNSSALRLQEDIPLVVPEINGSIITKKNRLLANPNCSTIIVLMAMYAIHQKYELETMNVSTYQAVSGAGILGIAELEHQIISKQKEEEPKASVFSQPIAYNVIPQIGNILENGYTSEEMKMQNEGRKILNHHNLKVNCTCVRVPVIRSHSANVTFTLKHQTSIKELETLLKNTQGIELHRNEATPYYTSNQDLVRVDRLREDVCGKEGYSFSLWCCGDQIRKGAASNAVQIMKLVEEQKTVV